MKANELRIGNYVNVPNKNQSPFRIDAFEYLSDDFGKLAMNSGDNTHPATWYLINVEPIPLTEEWLLKLRSRESMPVKYKDIYIMLDRFLLTYQASYGFWYVYDFSGEEMLYITKVEFVHEWQNVYFALNGEELTLTEPPTPAS